MRILVVGASGAIGGAIESALQGRHEVIRANRSTGDIRIDMTDEANIAAAFAEVGPIDAVAVAAGELQFSTLAEMTTDELAFSINAKLLGQVNLARHALKTLTDRGSITLVSGIIGEQPVTNGSIAALVNRGIEGFALGASVDMPRGIRINAVSPGIVAETQDRFAPMFNGFEGVPARKVATAYVRSIEGGQTGQIYRTFL